MKNTVAVTIGSSTESEMANSFSALHDRLLQLSEPILDSLSRTNYTPPESATICVKSIIESLLLNSQNKGSVKDFALACALLSSAQTSTHDLLLWIPSDASAAAESGFRELSRAYMEAFGERNLKKIGEMGVECGLVSDETRLVLELIPQVLPLLKERIQESSIGDDEDGDEVAAASARAPVGFAIVAAHQFRWFFTQIDYSKMGKLCTLVIPCALAALDHWSPGVKEQGMLSFIHLARKVNASDLSWYGDVILDACCQNIACDDELWDHVVEMSVLLVTSLQQSNPRSLWLEKMLNEMLSHLERQPRNKERRTAWLKLTEPLLSSVGLVLLAHFRRIFPLFFQWMHADDDQTVLLVLEKLQLVIRLTWIRNTPYIERLIDELAVLYKEASLKSAREEIRTYIIQILVLLQQCKGKQFEVAWNKHSNDPNLGALLQALSGIA